MNGPQDLGGMMGFGPVIDEPVQPVFHAPWEERALALSLAMGFLGFWNIDRSRSARESLAPAVYLSSSYYRIWTLGLIRLMVDAGLVTEDEVAQGRALVPSKTLTRPAPDAAAVPAILAAGGPSERPITAPARYAVGDVVRARNVHPTGHTRLPRYVRGHVGTVIAVHGAHVFPDSNARFDGEAPQWLYGVSFTAAELWGDGHRQRDTVQVDMWESYLEPV